MTKPAFADWTRTPNAFPGVETFIIDPPGLGTALRISIARPVQPAAGPRQNIPAPVIYATDADYLFGTVLETARMGGYGGDIAPAFVVGVGYEQERGDLAFTSQRRFLDFYRGPRRGFDAGAYGHFEFGGADAFLAALRDHVMPRVEHHASTIDSTRRVLLGTSAGGHFAAYVLAHHPELFQAYAMMSPMLVDPQTPQDGVIPRTSGDGVMVKLIDELAKSALPPGLRVFLSAGEREEDPGSMFADFDVNTNAMRMRSALAHRGVTTDYVQFAGETHGSVPGAAISRALRFLLPPAGLGPAWQSALAGDTA